MRLVPLFLGLSLAAQTPVGKLPWESALPLPWQAEDCGAPPADLAVTPPQGPLQVQITQDGALRITDDRGVILLRTGLPGRPVRIWRDGGLPAEGQPLTFPRDSLIGRGIGHLSMGRPDFRANLTGLLWILCDDGKVLTAVHPATSRLCYFPLPGGRNSQIQFHPDRLEVHLEPAPGTSECWAVPWVALIPHLIELGRENPANKPTGTALLPYPRS